MADYRSLQAWKSARAVTGYSLLILRKSPKTTPGAFLEQLCRAALSVQLNIAEGYALGTRPQFRRHLAIAFGSAIEVDEILTTSLEERLIETELGVRALAECRRSERTLLGLLKKFRPLE